MKLVHENFANYSYNQIEPQLFQKYYFDPCNRLMWMCSNIQEFCLSGALETRAQIFPPVFPDLTLA